MTRRFDRGPAGERHHVISLCALAHLDFNMTGAHSYDQYLQSVKALRLGGEDLQQAYRRMVFNVMAVNHEDHTKNFAFLRRQAAGGNWHRAFDVTHAFSSNSSWLVAISWPSMGSSTVLALQISMLWAKGTTSRGTGSGPRGA